MGDSLWTKWGKPVLIFLVTVAAVTIAVTILVELAWSANG